MKDDEVEFSRAFCDFDRGKPMFQTWGRVYSHEYKYEYIIVIDEYEYIAKSWVQVRVHSHEYE